MNVTLVWPPDSTLHTWCMFAVNVPNESRSFTFCCMNVLLNVPASLDLGLYLYVIKVHVLKYHEKSTAGEYRACWARKGAVKSRQEPFVVSPNKSASKGLHNLHSIRHPPSSDSEKIPQKPSNITRHMKQCVRSPGVEHFWQPYAARLQPCVWRDYYITV